MTNKEAKDVLLNYTCCCKYGTSPINCSDEECDFGKAIKTLCNRPQGKWIECTKSGMPLTEYGRMTGEKWYGFKCSQCNFIYKGNALVECPFCQKCGADMRGKDHEG